jgi:hypothetical protein
MKRRNFSPSIVEPRLRPQSPVATDSDMSWFFHRNTASSALIMLVVLLCPMVAMASRAVAPSIHNTTLVYKTVEVYEGTPLGTITKITYTMGHRKRVPPSRPEEGYTSSTTRSTRAELQLALLNTVIADAVYDKPASEPAELCITKATDGYLVVHR